MHVYEGFTDRLNNLMIAAVNAQQDYRRACSPTAAPERAVEALARYNTAWAAYEEEREYHYGPRGRGKEVLRV